MSSNAFWFCLPHGLALGLMFGGLLAGLGGIALLLAFAPYLWMFVGMGLFLAARDEDGALLRFAQRLPPGGPECALLLWPRVAYRYLRRER